MVLVRRCGSPLGTREGRGWSVRKKTYNSESAKICWNTDWIDQRCVVCVAKNISKHLSSSKTLWPSFVFFLFVFVLFSAFFWSCQNGTRGPFFFEKKTKTSNVAPCLWTFITDVWNVFVLFSWEMKRFTPNRMHVWPQFCGSHARCSHFLTDVKFLRGTDHFPWQSVTTVENCARRRLLCIESWRVSVAWCDDWCATCSLLYIFMYWRAEAVDSKRRPKLWCFCTFQPPRLQTTLLVRKSSTYEAQGKTGCRKKEKTFLGWILCIVFSFNFREHQPRWSFITIRPI